MINSVYADLGLLARIGIVIVIAMLAHLAIRLIHMLARRLLNSGAVNRWAKIRTLAELINSALIFTLYFVSVGLILREFGVSLTAYIASASIVGLAIGFGSQGLVQDVVTGLTTIFSDLFQVGDLVEISGMVGTVQSIGMRFTTLLNPLGAQVFIPNRTLSNIIVYPRGYVRCFADITLAPDESAAGEMQSRIDAITRGFVQQYQGIFRDQPEIGSPTVTPDGRRYLRIKFRVWPGRSLPIETAYRQEIIQALKSLDGSYADWMVSINNEIADRPAVIRPFRRRSSTPAPAKQPGSG